MPSPVIGLTGGIGAGKSTVEGLFASLGIPCVDTDRIAHQLTAAGGAAMPALVAQFGAAIQTPEGALDRGVMRQKVFADAGERQRLEAILHPLILAESRRLLASLQEAPYVLLAVPLLFETPAYRNLVAETLLVDCEPRLQRERVMQRSGLPAVQVDAIIAAQMPRAERLALADAVLDNSGDLALLSRQVENKHRYYLQRFAAANLATPSNSVDPAL
ncbi:dephospho-CoA kinase [Vogesella fluminis]|uniref:Dephospho-CoA kinase n=1 Tax=Vogesella fluminis TaxID=1069161 RepID=A0ABQ3H9H4_9NEIS|nr:dephospho-CoA kinase [Vogesella fluminis]GHD74389.1 dephospho-CoA kinase [Vogesella fluminis]